MKTLLWLFLLLSHSLTAATSNNTRSGTWFGFFHKKALPENYALWTEAQFRYLLDSTGMQQTLYRFGLLNKLNDHYEMGFVYAYVQTGLMKEHRPTLQHLQLFGAIGEVKFSARSRLEFRMLEDSPDDSIRFRYQIRAQKRIHPQVDLVIWDEPFINLTQDAWTGERSLERNRFFLGTRLPLWDMQAEVGYTNQFIPRLKDVTEHILTLYLFY